MKKFWKSPIDQEQSSEPQTPVAAFSKKLSLSLTPNSSAKHAAIKTPQYSPCFTGKSSRRSSFASNSPGNKSNVSSEFTDAEESEEEQDTSSNIMCLQLLPTESKRNLLTNWECIPPPKSPTPESSNSNKNKKIKKRPPTRSVAGSTKREEKRVPT